MWAAARTALHNKEEAFARTADHPSAAPDAADDVLDVVRAAILALQRDHGDPEMRTHAGSSICST